MGWSTYTALQRLTQYTNTDSGKPNRSPPTQFPIRPSCSALNYEATMRPVSNRIAGVAACAVALLSFSSLSCAQAAKATPAQAEQRASMEDLDAARRAFESDPGVQGLKERFGATLLPETIRPVK